MMSEINFELKIQSGQPRRRDLSTRKKKISLLESSEQDDP